MDVRDTCDEEAHCVPETVVSLAFNDLYVSLFHLFVHDRIYEARKFCLKKTMLHRKVTRTMGKNTNVST